MVNLDRALEAVRDFSWPARARAVPEAVERLLGDDPAERLDALLTIQIDVADQDVVDGLTARAFPLLLDVATHPANAGGPYLLRWMVDLILDDHTGWLGQGFHPKKGEGRDYLAGTDGKHLRACYRALVDGREAFVRMLGEPSSEGRIVGAFSLAWLGESAVELVGPLEKALSEEQEPGVRASLLAALGHLGRYHGDDALRRILQEGREASDEDVALAATWGAVACHPGPLPGALVEALVRAYEGPEEVRWGGDFPWALRSHAAILPQLRQALDGEHRRRVMATLIEAVGSGVARGQPAALTLGRHLLVGEAPAVYSDEQRAFLDPLVEQPWVERSPLLQDLRLPPLDNLRAALGKERLGTPSVLEARLEVDGDEDTLRALWKGTADGGVRSPERLVDAILESALDPWACFFEGGYLDPRPLLPGQPVDGQPIAPLLLDAIIDRQDPLDTWEGVVSFARRATTDRSSLPRPLDTAKGLWRSILEVATRLRPAAVAASEGPLEPLREVLLAYDEELGGRESTILRGYLDALSDDAREACVLALMANDPRPGPANHRGHRYADVAKTPRVSEVALDNMEATVRGGHFGRMNARTIKQRTAAKAATASRWAPAIHESSLPRLGELARTPIEVGKHDDRDVFAFMLAELGGPAVAELVQLLFDGKKAIRTLALEALEALDPSIVAPHLEPLRRSKKKEHRQALAALVRD